MALVLPVIAHAQYLCTTNRGEITITGYTGSGGAVTIPSMLNGLPVTSIGFIAFENCNGLTSVVIPDSVTSIVALAFRKCRNLTHVTLPNSIASIEDDTFDCCSSLTSVTIPDGVTSIGGLAFGYCTSLTNVTIPGSVTSIGGSAFASCSSLTGIMLPKSVTSIGDQAFCACTKLTSVYFQGNAPSQAVQVFDGDANATVYYLPGTTGWTSMFDSRSTVLWNPQVLHDASFGARTNQFGFTISGASNLVIVVETCTDLAHPAWSPVATNTLVGGLSYFSDIRWTNYPARFYRFRSP